LHYCNYVYLMYICIFDLYIVFLQIDEEFERLYKGASDKFLAKFVPFYVPRILTYCSTARPDLFKKSCFIKDGKFYCN